jgi:hypothetical protein
VRRGGGGEGTKAENTSGSTATSSD